MKKIILKSVFSIVSILVFCNAMWFFITYFWVKTTVSGCYLHIANEAVPVLSGKLEGTIISKEIKSILSDYSFHPDVVTLAVIDKEGKVIFAHGPKKREQLISLLNLKFPIIKDDKIIGYLQLWPTPESIFRELAQKKNVNIFFLLLLGWFSLTSAAIFLYIYRGFLFPLGKLTSGIDKLGKDDYILLDSLGSNNHWGKLSEKINGINVKLTDVTTTLNMLFSASRTLTSSLEVNEIFNTVLSIIQKKFEDLPCSVLLIGEDGFLKIRSQRGLSPNFVQATHLRPGESYAGQAYKKNEMIVVNDISKEKTPVNLRIFEKEGIKSFIFMPLIVESKCIGVLNANSQESGYFTDDTINTLLTLAEYLSIGLRNAKLYERVQEYNRRLGAEVSSTTRELIQTNSRLIQKAREMKALSDIASSAASKVNLSEILEIVVEQIKKLLSAQTAGFLLHSADKNEIMPYPPFFGIHDRDFSGTNFQLNKIKLLQSVIGEGKYYIINNAQQAKNALPVLNNLLDVYSLVLVPLRSGERIIGILGVANKFGSPFDNDDLRILELIADRISGIIDNVRLYQELQQRLRDLTALQEISSSISSEPVLNETLKKIISTSTKAFNADLCTLMLYNEDADALVLQPGAYFTGSQDIISSNIPVKNNNSLMVQVFSEGKAFISPDASIDPQIQNKTVQFLDIRSLILVPLKSENRVIGVLRIGKHQANCYVKEHLRLASLIANQAAIIIENARLYDSLREAKEKLEQLNQIKNEFISIVSHELRTPITAIKGFVKVVLQGEAGDLNSQQDKFLKIVDQSVDRLINLITELLDISRIESGKIKLKMDSFDAKTVINNVLESLQSTMQEKKIKIEINLPDNLPSIMADRERLYQVFDNLIMNSFKFTPDNGTITIFAEDKGDYILFGVRDTGIGISETDQKKIFEKFFRVDSSFNRVISGAGLGLSIVKSIVELHNGKIWVESRLNEGATFKFMMPRAKTEIKSYKDNDTNQ